MVGNGSGRGNGGGCGGIGADRFCAVGKLGRIETLIGTLGGRIFFGGIDDANFGAKVGLLLPIGRGTDGIDGLLL